MKLEIYDILRKFHKQILIPLMGKKSLSDWEKCALETLSGVFYLVEQVFSEDK